MCPGFCEPNNCQGFCPFEMPSSNTSSHELIRGISAKHSSPSSCDLLMDLIIHFLKCSWVIRSACNPMIRWMPSLVLPSSTTRLTLGFWKRKTGKLVPCWNSKIVFNCSKYRQIKSCKSPFECWRSVTLTSYRKSRSTAIAPTSSWLSVKCSVFPLLNTSSKYTSRNFSLSESGML